ncbi:fimbria/pilus outer membrane usher protein [Comamonas sp. GB3 AK4-5]|uniref:fimbria/pilus outer membrane usher protein n=1 Tax=Comamonas sp. GB3 AK4-5 TaxID=3231487 RepID=UPI00351EF70A
MSPNAVVSSSLTVRQQLLQAVCVGVLPFVMVPAAWAALEAGQQEVAAADAGAYSLQKSASLPADVIQVAELVLPNTSVAAGALLAGAQAPESPGVVQMAALSGAISQSFNMAFLYGSASMTDLQALLAGSGVPEGVQRTELHVNQLLVGRRDIEFSHNPQTGEVEPCLTPEMLLQMGVDFDKLPQTPDADASCLRLPEWVPGATAVYDMANLRLNLDIPQLYLAVSRRGYVDPSLWDDGERAGFLNYNVNVRQDKADGEGSNNSISAGLQMGANLGAWRVRNNSYVTSGSGQSTKFTSQNTYAQRGIAKLSAQLQLGESYTRSQLFDNVRFLGAQLISDEAMRPDSEQGYAPVIRGTAESNATVEVRQNGYLIYSANVAAGPFEIQDLSPSGGSGDLEIIIIEANGTRRTLRQAFSSPPLMVREGRIKYDAAMGQVRLNNDMQTKPSFLSGSALYGLNTSTTLAMGLNASEGFSAYSLGVGLNTAWGAISVDGTHSSSSVHGERASGERLKMRYGKFIESSRSNISVNLQRSLSQGYRTLSDHVLASEAQFGPGMFWGQGSSRQRLDISLAQQIGQGNLYFSGSFDKGWSGANARSLSLSYGNTWGQVSYNLGYTYSRNIYSTYGSSQSGNNHSLMLTLNIPLGRHAKAPQGFSNLSRDKNGTSVQAGVSGLLPTEREISYMVSGGRTAEGQANAAASMGMLTSFARMDAGYSYGSGYHSGSFAAAGSVVAHGGGVNVSQSLGETFILAKVEPPVPGVGISSYAGVETGSNGYAVIPNANPYRTNLVSLDTRGAPKNVDFDNAAQHLVPTRGAMTVAHFKAETGRRVQFELRTAEGKPFPFGAQVGLWGKRIGLTDTRGRVLVMLPAESQQGELTVEWEGKACKASYQLPPVTEDANYQRLSIDCIESSGPRGRSIAEAETTRKEAQL